MVKDMPDLHNYNKDHRQATFIKGFKLDLSICSSYCLSLFSVVNQFSVVNILCEYKNPSQRRINKLVTRAPIIPLLVYLTVSLSGYWSCGTQTPDIIINRLASDTNKDTLMQIGKTCKKKNSENQKKISIEILKISIEIFKKIKIPIEILKKSQNLKNLKNSKTNN